MLAATLWNELKWLFLIKRQCSVNLYKVFHFLWRETESEVLTYYPDQIDKPSSWLSIANFVYHCQSIVNHVQNDLSIYI